MKEIVQKGNNVLRQVAKEVDLSSITRSEIQTIVAEMKEALLSQEDGVAIAAPQIGYSLRIFVVSHKMFTHEKIGSTKEDRVFINPHITKTSKEREAMEEGCLSVRWWYGSVLRHKKATVEAYDETGKK